MKSVERLGVPASTSGFPLKRLITPRGNSGVTRLSIRCRRLLENGQRLIERFELRLYRLELFLELIQTGELGFDYPLPCNQLIVRLT